MPSNEYLQQVTTGEVEELNGEIVRCEYDESWAKEDIENALNGNSCAITEISIVGQVSSIHLSVSNKYSSSYISLDCLFIII